jgi:HEAT repeats
MASGEGARRRAVLIFQHHRLPRRGGGGGGEGSRTDGEEKWLADPLENAAAFAAVRKRGISDPWQLAALALHFLNKGGAPLRDANEATDQPAAIVAQVTAPRVQGKTLELWARDQRGDNVVRYQVDLEAATLSAQTGAQLAAVGQDVVAQALQLLAGSSDTMYPGAIDALVAACSQPRARTALHDVIRNHGNTSAREWAAFQAASCHDDETVAILIQALDKDRAAGVRKNAADALGKLAASKARTALERAQKDPDMSVRGAAERAIAKLRGA